MDCLTAAMATKLAHNNQVCMALVFRDPLVTLERASVNF